MRHRSTQTNACARCVYVHSCSLPPPLPPFFFSTYRVEKWMVAARINTTWMAIKQEVHFGLPRYFLPCTVRNLSPSSVFVSWLLLFPFVRSEGLLFVTVTCDMCRDGSLCCAAPSWWLILVFNCVWWNCCRVKLNVMGLVSFLGGEFLLSLSGTNWIVLVSK